MKKLAALAAAAVVMLPACQDSLAPRDPGIRKPGRPVLDHPSDTVRHRLPGLWVFGPQLVPVFPMLHRRKTRRRNVLELRQRHSSRSSTKTEPSAVSPVGCCVQRGRPTQRRSLPTTTTMFS